MKKNISIKSKIILLSSLSLLATICIFSGVSFFQSHEVSRITTTASRDIIFKTVDKRLSAQASYNASQIQQLFAKKLTLLATLTDQISILNSAYAKQGVNERIIRQQINSSLALVFNRDATLDNIWLIMNENLVGQDSEFVDDLSHGSNSTGKLSTTWIREAGIAKNLAVSNELILTTELSANGVPYNFFFTCPNKTKSSCISEPFIDNSTGVPVLTATISEPVIIGGAVVGVVGTDISLNSLQQIAMDIKKDIYDGAGELSVLSGAGTLAAFTRDSSLLGMQVDKDLGAAGQQLWSQIVAGVEQLVRLEDSIRVLAPVSVKAGMKDWWVVLDVPKSVIEADAASLQTLQGTLQRSATINTSIIALIAAVIGMLLMWFTASNLVKPINNVAAMLKEIASGDGDLTKRITYGYQDELGNLVFWFNSLLDKLQPTLQKIKGSITETRATANQSLQIAQQTSVGMQTQLSDIDQVVTASNEMSATAQDVAANAARAAEAAQGVDRSAKQGLISIDDSMREVEELSESVTAAMLDIQTLAANSDEIGHVLEVIRGVAEQTNLLALNAAIEAARAGESGRGFAVVADEVRNLAMRTQNSVEQIRVVIERLLKGTSDAVEMMQTSHQKALVSSQQMKGTVESFSRISSAVSIISEMNIQIAAAAEQQSAVAEEVNRNITNVRAVTDSLSARAEDAAQMSKQLNILADSQFNLAEQFKT
ncbi:chemotaxis protein [Pseudomonas jessenii]|uniref:Chemotaxis protein n=2 Tax=Pseudomonas jessenii TaxID=77298 RepID=A0A2W0EXD9_PSEJE|nr:methyl-accepting chemotaxis protein [Pseudomonas jessenii]PYY72506.1 chemotaxis protein [Pseudomonas jessenii]